MGNSTLPVSVKEHSIDAATVVRDSLCCLTGLLLVALNALVIRKLAKRYFVRNMTDSGDESAENEPSRRQPRGIRNLRRVLLGRPSSSRVVQGVAIGEEALPDDSSESESGLDQNEFSAIRLPRYTSVMSLAHPTPDQTDSPPSYELATSPLPSYEEATTIEVADDDSEGTQPRRIKRRRWST